VLISSSVLVSRIGVGMLILGVGVNIPARVSRNLAARRNSRIQASV